ncbi:hypothetical protein [Yersinia hibernica]|uniref:hypothetical protein n=1 Tax=Yersinia hibernica TaxID=2339259 RepID=UPI00042EF189|nr:hypothetical protein [Yersinia hibernica]
MKSDTACLALIVVGWFFICVVITTTMTKGPLSPDRLVVLSTLFFTPALLKPLSRCMLLFRKPPFVLMKKQHRTWLHLNPWLSTGQPGLRDINRYWRALTDTLSAGLAQPEYTIILSSHLLSSRRTARLLRHFPSEQYWYHALSRPVSRAERSGLQLETLLKEWRWYSPSLYCGVLIIRKKDRRCWHAVLETHDGHQTQLPKRLRGGRSCRV